MEVGEVSIGSVVRRFVASPTQTHTQAHNKFMKNAPTHNLPDLLPTGYAARKLISGTAGLGFFCVTKPQMNGLKKTFELYVVHDHSPVPGLCYREVRVLELMCGRELEAHIYWCMVMYGFFYMCESDYGFVL